MFNRRRIFVRQIFARALGVRGARYGKGPADTGAQRLERTLFLTQAGLLLERGAVAFWPFASALALVFALRAFNMGEMVEALPVGGAAGHALMVVLAWGLLSYTLGWGLSRFHWPDAAQARARLDNSLPGRPLTAVSDEMALGNAQDPAVQALWQAHIARMRAEAEAAAPVSPKPDLARRDPFALRLSALTAVVLALLFGAPWQSLTPGAPGGAPAAAIAAPGTSWEGWASPPRYTGKPGLYLNALEGDALSVPAGTRFAFRFYGARPTFSETLSNPAAQDTRAQGDGAQPAGTVTAQDFEAVRSGVITVGARRYEVEVLPDAAPNIRLAAPAERRADGKFVQEFQADDDYGVVSGVARIRLDLAKVDRRFGLAPDPAPREDIVLDLPMPLSGSRAAFTERLTEDLSQSAWANLPVTLELSVTDGRGQTGITGPVAMELPGRRFFDPRAAALIEARRDLLWSPANDARTAEVLRAVANRPDTVFAKPEMGASVVAVALALEQPDLDDAGRAKLEQLLWQLAVVLEDGGMSDALQAMQQAQQKLSEAMRNGASADEIAKLMQDLKTATDAYLKMLAERADPQEGPQFGKEQPKQQITGNQIQQLMDKIQQLMEQGKMAEAQELLDQLARMMQNLKVTQGQGGEGDIPGGPQMKALQDTLRDQQKLSDDAFQDLQKQQGQPGAPSRPGQNQQGQPSGEGQGQGMEPHSAPGQMGRAPEGSDGQSLQGQGGASQGQNGDGSSASSGQAPSGTLAQRQQELLRDLERQRGLMPHLEGGAGEQAQRSFEEAGRAMDQAGQALAQGDNGRALDHQADAIQALREGMRSLREAQNQTGSGADRAQGAEGQQRGGDAAGGAGNRLMSRDPLGRASGDGRNAGTEHDMLPGDDVYGRARDLLDEIRRRSSERDRSQDELDYLGRLLERF